MKLVLPLYKAILYHILRHKYQNEAHINEVRFIYQKEYSDRTNICTIKIQKITIA
jgi:trans-2-enoyl-CoA reductase